jgi:DNA-binding transcriptional LysR family regulator
MDPAPPLDLGLLVMLDALLQEGSVTGAARRTGRSPPAVSHALARLRARLRDPLLVRTGRGMVPTPRADALRARVHALVTEASLALSPEAPLEPAALERGFTVLATDYVLTILGLELDRALHAEAPSLSLRFSPNTPDDPGRLRDGGADLAVGIYGNLPSEMRTRQLLTDRFVVVVRTDHPGVGKRLSLDGYLALPHLQVAPRGQPGGYLDDLLGARGLRRRVARAIPYFLPALFLASRTDYLLTVSERIAERMAPGLGLRILEPPLPLEPYALSLVWHPRFDGDAGHRFLREVLARVARAAAPETHPGARTRLGVRGRVAPP